MIDYLSRVNDVPICDKYDDIRRQKLSSPIYANGVVLRSEILQSEQPLRDAEAEAIPEFMRFNIVESEVRNIV